MWNKQNKFRHISQIMTIDFTKLLGRDYHRQRGESDVLKVLDRVNLTQVIK